MLLYCLFNREVQKAEMKRLEYKADHLNKDFDDVKVERIGFDRSMSRY